MKRVIFISFLIAIGCASEKNAAEQNTENARQMFEAFNRHDWRKMSAFYSEAAQFLDPSFGTDYVTKTRGETAAKYQEMQNLFPDIHDEVIGMYASGDKVTVEFISTGTAPDGTKFKLPIVSILTFENAVIIRDATYYDIIRDATYYDNP
jgi:ketosteroid isomerase-like protein